MKTFISLIALGFSSFVSAYSLQDFSVYSKNNIDYARSDFEGLAGAGKNIFVEDFLFTEGAVSGETFQQTRGRIQSGSVVAGNSILFNQTAVRSDLIARGVYLDQTTVNGKIRANYLKITTGYMGYETSSYSSWKRISVREANDRSLNLSTELNAVALEMDSFSEDCKGLMGSVPLRRGSQLIFTGNAAVEVFEIGAEELSAVNELIFATAENATVIINVSGKDLSLNGVGIKLNAQNPEKMIWNIYEAENVLIQHSGSSETYAGREIGIPGIVLAPLAKVSFFEAVVTGKVFVKNLDGKKMGFSGGQVNGISYTGISCKPRRPGKH